VSLTVPALLLITSGVLMQYNLVPEVVKTQLIALGVGLVLFVLVTMTRLQEWQRYALVVWVVSIGLLVLPLILGAVTRGSSRWIQIFGMTLQTSELARPLLMVVFADLAVRWKNTRLFLLRYVIAGLIPMLLLFVQPDLGTTMLLVIGWLAILLVKGFPRRWLVGSLILVLAVAPLMWFGMRDYQRTRLMTFVNPSLDPLGAGYNVLQARIAIGSGQLTGRGIGLGTQSHLQFLPESHTDFMLASIGEETGYVGTLGVLVLYALLFGAIYKVCMQTEGFGAYLAWGLLIMAFGQFFINAAMNVGLMPVTGVTLPLLSYGGSSLIGMLLTLGFLNVVANDIPASSDIWIH